MAYRKRLGGNMAGVLIGALLVLAGLPNRADALVAEGRVRPLLGPCTLIDAFLNQLMMAESGGRLTARNPRSSALGPYQFIKATFLDVSRRRFPDETGGLTAEEVLALRTDLGFSRRVADAYSRENAAFLRRRGLRADPTNLRLAFFAGPTGAARVLAAEPETSVSILLKPAAIDANPFLGGMTAEQLIAKSARETRLDGIASLYPRRARRATGGHAKIKVRCNLGRASCRKWLALAKRRLARKMAGEAARKTAAGN